MLPEINNVIDGVEEQPSYTYYLNIENNRISGYVDQLASMEQAVYLILNVERYESPIYNWDYGVELQDLIGQELSYVQSEVQRRISEALLIDDRITNIRNFTTEQQGNMLICRFDVVTTVGTLYIQKGVLYNV